MLNSEYKIVFCDIDGTLVDDNKYMTEETQVEIKKLVENGVYFVLTSGKPFSIIKEFAEKCNAIPYVIGSNGGIVYDYSKNKTIYSRSIDTNTILELLNFIEQYNTYKYVTVLGDTIVEEEKYGFTPKNRKDVKIVPSIKKYIEGTKDPILKISLYDPDKQKLINIREMILQKFDLNTVPVDKFIVPEKFKEKKDKSKPDPYIIEAMNKNVSKAEAIKELTKYLNIDLSKTVAIGDGANDYDMLKVVNYKIAMENAVPEVKNIADMITDSNNNSGVAKAINKLFFI